MRILVGISGGVDSAYAAKKLLRENRERNDFTETKNLEGVKR